LRIGRLAVLGVVLMFVFGVDSIPMGIRAHVLAAPGGTLARASTATPTHTPTLTPTPQPTGAATSGLVAAYAFEEGSGSTVADASGHGNTGTISGAVWTDQGRYGRALAFNGTTSWVTVNGSAALNLTTGMTLEAWVFPTQVGGWRAVILKE